MNIIELQGTVSSGEGNGGKYLALPWVKEQIEAKLGFIPYLGTLNLTLNKKGISRKRMLEKTKADTICPQKGYCIGLLFAVVVESIHCAVVVPKTPGYPDNLLEIMSEVNLRERLGLEDGDVVTVSFET